LLELTFGHVTFFLSLEIDSIDSSVLFKVNLVSELTLDNLSSSLFVQIGITNSSLQLLELVTLGANLLDLSLPLFVLDLHLGHFSGKTLLHSSEVDSLSLGGVLVLLANRRVELGLSEI
jgi:hypothetical protein